VNHCSCGDDEGHAGTDALAMLKQHYFALSLQARHAEILAKVALEQLEASRSECARLRRDLRFAVRATYAVGGLMLALLVIRLAVS
jgi:hypothetical protein